MGEHHDDRENQPTHPVTGSAVDPQSASMSPDTPVDASVNYSAYSGPPGPTGHSPDHETQTATDQSVPRGAPLGAPFTNPVPPSWQYADPSAAAPTPPGYPGTHAALASHGQYDYHSGHPGSMGYAYHYPPYGHLPSPYYPPYPGGPQGAPQVPLQGAPAHGGQGGAPSMNHLINQVASGDHSSLASLGQLVNFDDKEFWKGALVGAAAVLLLTNDSVQQALFRAGSKAKQAVTSGVEKVKKATADTQETTEEK